MESTLVKIDKNVSELTVELGKDELKKYVDLAEKDLTSHAKIDGFRKGKAPKDLVKKQVGEKEVLETALDLALRSSLSRVIDEKELEVLRAEKLEIQENTPEKLIYKVKLVLFPLIKLGDLDKIKVQKKEVEVSEEEVTETLKTIQNSRSKFEDIETELKDGDRAEVDFEVKKEGVIIEGGSSKNHPVIIGSKNFIPGFEETLIGMKKGEEKTFSLDAPKDYFAKNLAGHKLDFYVKIINTQKIVRPELNDEFAKSLGNFTVLEDLKKNLKEGIAEEKKVKEQQRARIEVLNKIIESSEIEVPDDFVASKLDEMIMSFDNDLHQKGMELAFYLAHVGKTQEDLKKDWRKDAEKQVKYNLIIQKIAKEKDIQAKQEEIDAIMAQRVQMLSLYGKKIEDFDANALKENVSSEITTEKSLEYLDRHCIV